MLHNCEENKNGLLFALAKVIPFLITIEFYLIELSRFELKAIHKLSI